MKRRQRRNRQDADQKERARPRHAAGDAAEPVEIACAGAGFDRAGADEQERLVDRVIGEVIQRGDQRDAGDDVLAGRREKSWRRRCPAATMPMFSIVLCASRRFISDLDRRVEDADQGREAADHQHE